MTKFHAVVWIDHQHADIVQFDADESTTTAVKAHTHHTAQHGSGVRTEHEYFGQVCDGLDGVTEVLVTGGKTTLADLRHYAEKHRPATAQRIVGWQVVDHPSPRQLLAQAREFFLKHDRMAGVPTPT